MKSRGDDLRLEPGNFNAIQSFSIKYWWLNFVRGIAALAIGIGLFLPAEVFLEVDLVQTILFRFIGIYFLISGIMSLIWGYITGRETGLWLLAGIMGVTGGILFLLRYVLEGAFSTQALTIVFGLILVMSGSIHFLGGFRLGETVGRRWSLGHEFLGIVEVSIGILVIISLFTTVENLKVLLSFWGLIAGVGLIGDGIRMYRFRKRMENATAG